MKDEKDRADVHPSSFILQIVAVVAGLVVNDKTKEATSGVVGAVKDTAEQLASSVGSVAVQAKEKVQDVVGATAEKVGEAGQEVTALIRRYPLPALLVGRRASCWRKCCSARLWQGRNPSYAVRRKC